MTYTVQIHIAGYAPALGTDVEHVTTRRLCADVFRFALKEADRAGATIAGSSAFVYVGHHADVTDVYPDGVLDIGPRGGVRWTSPLGPTPKKYQKVYILQGDYGYGWDDLTGSDNWRDVKADARDYRANQPGAYRIVTRRVPMDKFLKGDW